MYRCGHDNVLNGTDWLANFVRTMLVLERPVAVAGSDDPTHEGRSPGDRGSDEGGANMSLRDRFIRALPTTPRPALSDRRAT